MLQIQLSTEETCLLHEILESYLNNLRGEIHHTHSFEYRQALKDDAVTLKQLLHQLQPDMASA
jgi:hypothetical protein